MINTSIAVITVAIASHDIVVVILIVVVVVVVVVAFNIFNG